MHRIGPSAQCRSFTPEFKAEAVRLCQIGDRTISRIASDLNIGENALREWVQRAKIDSGDGPAGALTTDEREEFMRLRREHKRMLDGFGNPKKSGGILREKKPVRFIFIHRESECFVFRAADTTRGSVVCHVHAKWKINVSPSRLLLYSCEVARPMAVREFTLTLRRVARMPVETVSHESCRF